MTGKLLALVLSALSFLFILGWLLPVSGCSQQSATPLLSSQPAEKAIPDRETSQNLVGTKPLSAQLGAPLQLKIKQEALFAAENLTVKFLKVAEDSRCPADVTCLQEGQATVVLQFVGGGQNQEKQIQLSQKASQEKLARAIVGNYSIQLLAVSPYPQTTAAIAPADYAITLLVSKT